MSLHRAGKHCPEGWGLAMDSETGRSPTDLVRTKGSLVEGRIEGLRKYRRELVRDLAYGSVRLPDQWVALPESVVILLDKDAVLEEAQAQTCEDLLEHLVQFCGTVIPTLITRDVARRRSGGQRLTRAEVETLNRARGPRAVRDRLFVTCAGFPEHVPDHVGADVAEALDAVLRERGGEPSKVDEVAQLMELCREVVEEFAKQRRLGREAVGWLISEVSDQLRRNALAGRLPENLWAWARATTAAKWRFRSHGHPAEEQLSERASVSGDIGDEVAARLDTRQLLLAAGPPLARRAELLARLGPTEHVNAVAHDAAARILLTGNVDQVLDVMEATEEGRRILLDELARQGVQLSPDRQIAVQRIIRYALREAWREGHELGSRASS